MSDDVRKIGRRFAALRKHVGFTQEDVAGNVGLSKDIVGYLERGDGCTLENLLTLYRYYGNFFHMAGILGDEFELNEVSTANDNDMTKAIVAERLKLLKEEYGAELQGIIELLGK